MFGSAVLDVAIGLIFLFTLVSVICSAVREGIESLLKTRAAYLERGIRELLRDRNAAGLARAVFEHPLIAGLYSAAAYRPGKADARPRLLAIGRGLPSYIPARNFALALMDIAARGARTDAVSSHPAAPVLDLATVRANLLNIGNPEVQRVLLTAIDAAQDDFDAARAALEQWYDSAMDRVAGWYKGATQWVIFWLGLAVAVAFNVNTIDIAEFLYRNEAVRDAIVARAESVVAEGALPTETYEAARLELESLGLPIGWGEAKHLAELGKGGVWDGFVAPPLGWLLTALAAMLGAPFWFDLLNKIMVVRSTVKPREKSPEEGSEARQLSRLAERAGRQSGGDAPIAPGPGGAFPSAPRTAAAAGKVPSPPDEESAVDGCDIELDRERATPDDALPPAEGGVR